MSRLRLTLVIALLAGTPLASAAEQWRAGAAKIVVTPEQPMWMAGYASRKGPAEGKLTDLFAKALVLEDASGKRAALVTLDLVGIDRELSQSVCRRLEKELGLARQQVAINCSHTHTGPVVARNLRPMHYLQLDAEQTKLVDAYSHFLEERIVQVVADAIKRLAPAEVAWGSGQATFAVNRRTNVEANVPMLREQGLLKGPVDHGVPVLTVRNEARELVAVAFGYACHSTVLSFNEWSGDYPAFAQQALEATHPGAVALFWAGCGGDQNPLPRRTVELAQKYGQELAAAVERTLAAVQAPIAPTLATSYQEIPLPLSELPARQKLEEDRQSKDKYIAARARNLLQEIDEGKPLSSTYPYPVARWQLGQEVQWIFLGGEVVVDYAVRLKRELAGKNTWVAGYSNDVMAYIPSRRVLLEGGYEGGGAMVYYGLACPWAPEVEETIVKEVHRQGQ
jgi:hypothetical protein